MLRLVLAYMSTAESLLAPFLLSSVASTIILIVSWILYGQLSQYESVRFAKSHPKHQRS